MYCSKCGKLIAANNMYCAYCGTKVEGKSINLNGINSQQNNSPQSFQTSPQWPVGTVNSNAKTESVPVSFTAKKVFGQFLVSSVTIEIGNQQYKAGFGKTISIDIPSGLQNLTCYLNYLGKSGVANAQYNFIPGRQYNITYSSPMIVTSAGSLTIY